MLIPASNAIIFSNEALEGAQTVETLLAEVAATFNGHIPEGARRELHSITKAIARVQDAAKRQQTQKTGMVELDPVIAYWIGNMDVFVLELEKALK